MRLGCTSIQTNLGLLQAVRLAHPDAFIVYKPHPDVTTGNRKGRVALKQALLWANHVESHSSVVSCIAACDELHTLTSLSGFDALLRGKPVTTYGLPFYAGWGLTTDKAVFPASCLARRTRQLSLDELVAGALLRYPIYWDHDLKGVTTCMAALLRIQAQRDALQAQGRLHQLKHGFWRRNLRKLKNWLAIGNSAQKVAFTQTNL
jgi:capsular polysaccharide export protein